MAKKASKHDKKRWNPLTFTEIDDIKKIGYIEKAYLKTERLLELGSYIIIGPLVGFLYGGRSAVKAMENPDRTKQADTMHGIILSIGIIAGNLPLTILKKCGFISERHLSSFGIEPVRNKAVHIKPSADEGISLRTIVVGLLTAVLFIPIAGVDMVRTISKAISTKTKIDNTQGPIPLNKESLQQHDRTSKKIESNQTNIERQTIKGTASITSTSSETSESSSASSDPPKLG
jgi:hypothetical protein